MLIKKCCNKLLVPKIEFKANVADVIGLSVFLSFFLFIAYVFASFAIEGIVESIFDGTFIERSPWGKSYVHGGVFVLIIIYFLLPKLIHASSFLLNFTLKVKATCRSCSKSFVLADYPKNKEPF